MTDTSVYENPLLSRYASREMAENFSDDKNSGSGAGCGSPLPNLKKSSG